jgi:hypothetical protein
MKVRIEVDYETFTADEKNENLFYTNFHAVSKTFSIKFKDGEEEAKYVMKIMEKAIAEAGIKQGRLDEEEAFEMKKKEALSKCKPLRSADDEKWVKEEIDLSFMGVGCKSRVHPQIGEGL